MKRFDHPFGHQPHRSEAYLLGDNNAVTTQVGLSGVATNFLGDDNIITSIGGSFNGARNIAGSGNELTSGGPGSNRNLALNVLSGGNRLSAGGPGSNLNAAVNAGGGGNTISAGASGSEPGNLNAGFNFFGTRNTVTAGPGPLSLAGSVLQDGLTVTQENPGIAINNNRIGGPAAASGQSSTVPRQGSLVRNSLNFSPTGNNAASKSGNTSPPGGSARKSVSDQITRSVKKFSDTVSKVTGGLAVGAKTGAASTSNK